jgi:hypothetical protein
MSHIDHIPATFYAHGKDALDVALEAAELHIEMRDQVRTARAEDASSFPIYGPTDAKTIAARIIGDLMGAGWTPPSEEDIKTAADRSRAASERFQEWYDALTINRRRYVMSYFSRHGEFPEDCCPPKDEQTRIADGDDEPPALEAS